MNDSDTTLREHLEGAVEGIRRRERYWQEDEVPVDGVTNITYGTAREYERLAKSAVLLGATQQSRAWFGEAARFYLKHIRAGRLQRDMQDLFAWEGEPAMFSRAITNALLSRDEELLTEVASEALAMDASYLDAFSGGSYHGDVRFHSVKIEAALVLNDERAARLLEKFRAELQALEVESQFWEIVPKYHQALIDGNASAAEAATEELVGHFIEVDPEPDDPDEYVLDNACAYVLLAQRYGVEVTPNSDRLPAALLREEPPADDIELDVDLTDLRVTSRAGFFEFERDEEGRPVIAGRIYHPGGEPVSMEDVPERDAGQVLSDGWIEAAIAEASWQDRHDRELVTDAEAAFEDGTLERKLVVVQDRIDGLTIDESIGDSPIGTIDFLKGAARLD